MKNYMFTDIQDFRDVKNYPDPNSPEISKRFKSLEEYWEIAERVIKKFAPEFVPKKIVNQMLNSDDAISEVARHLMMGDWRFKNDRNRGDYSYRNQCGKWAIMDYLGLSKTKANKEIQSLDVPVCKDREEYMTMYGILRDSSAQDPKDYTHYNERHKNIKKYIDWLLRNSNLTDVQKKCIDLYYIRGIDSPKKIGEMLDPPISRQAVKQNLDMAISKLQQIAVGTKVKT